MVRISVNELTTYRWSFEEDVQHYAESGVEAIAVWRQKLSDFGEAKGIELIRDSNLTVACLLWAGGFTGSDGRSYKESVQDAVEAIHLAADMQAGCLSVYSGARAGHTHNHARQLLSSALKELLPIAEQLGVTLALEPVHAGCAQEWTFLTDVDETCRLIQQVDHPCLKIAFDTYYFGRDPQLVQQFVENLSRLAIVHLGDGRQIPDGEQDRCLLGDGDVPLNSIIGCLDDAGYAGFFDIKLIGEEIETTDYQQLIQQCLQRVGQWADKSQ